MGKWQDTHSVSRNFPKNKEDFVNKETKGFGIDESAKEEKQVYTPPKEKKVKIMIEEQAGDENQGGVYVSVNGRAFYIRRGFEVEVPEAIVNVLKDAIITQIYQNPDTGEEVRKDVPRFNFRILG